MSACAMPTRCTIPFENFRSGSRRSPADAHLIEQRRDAPAPLGAVVAEQAGKIIEQLFGGEVVVKVRALREGIRCGA